MILEYPKSRYSIISRSTAKSYWAWYPVTQINHRAIDVELAGQYSIQPRYMVRAIKPQEKQKKNSKKGKK
jgi:hypothetical protein